MHPTRYLARLTERLTEGLRRLPTGLRRSHTAFLRGRQHAEGGFMDREGGPDLYYTGFGLRALAVLDALDDAVAGSAARYLRASLQRQASVVDFYSLLYSCLLLQVTSGIDVLADAPPDWPERVAGTLESFRTADGGYGKTAGAASGSTYHTFLVGLCYELLNRPMPGPERLSAFVLSRRREDGGFVEIAPMRRGGTNPTAAAVGLMQLLEEQGAGIVLTPEVRQGVVDFLVPLQSDEGGFPANSRAPLADLLSTFTSLWTLDQLGALARADTRDALVYTRSLEIDGGGFHGGVWDDATDVEYTFYGLGVLSLLFDFPGHNDG